MKGKEDYEELANVNEGVKTTRMGGSFAVSSAASTGSGTFTRPPSLGPNWRETWMPRKNDIEGWVRDWSTKEMTGLN